MAVVDKSQVTANEMQRIGRGIYCGSLRNRCQTRPNAFHLTLSCSLYALTVLSKRRTRYWPVVVIMLFCPRWPSVNVDQRTERWLNGLPSDIRKTRGSDIFAKGQRSVLWCESVPVRKIMQWMAQGKQRKTSDMACTLWLRKEFFCGRFCPVLYWLCDWPDFPLEQPHCRAGEKLSHFPQILDGNHWTVETNCRERLKSIIDESLQFSPPPKIFFLATRLPQVYLSCKADYDVTDLRIYLELRPF